VAAAPSCQRHGRWWRAHGLPFTQRRGLSGAATVDGGSGDGGLWLHHLDHGGGRGGVAELGGTEGRQRDRAAAMYMVASRQQ
jgi:hypothetical protein